MAGGLGSRLKPLTDELPKPLIKVGDKPILETVLGGFVKAGFGKFFISVNYKAEMIRDYFGDGSAWGVEISYLQENERLGTAGALSLLPERPTQPFFVMNGDLLTTVNFEQMLKYHREHQAFSTVCVREHSVTVPFGVDRFRRSSPARHPRKADAEILRQCRRLSARSWRARLPRRATRPSTCPP